MNVIAIPISKIVDPMSHLFFPPKLQNVEKLTFNDCINAVNNQRIARITKAALFALSSVVATILLVATETSFITWPLAIPAILISLISIIAFYRLNYLDERYVEGLDGKTRQTVAEQELTRIFFTSPPPSKENTINTLKNLNRLFGNEIFDKRLIQSLDSFYHDPNSSVSSLATISAEQNTPIIFSSNVEWFEKGQYGLTSYKYHVGINWDGNPQDSIKVAYKRIPTDKQGNGIETAVDSPISPDAKTANENQI